MKTLLTFIGGMALGALLLYAFLWYQVIGKVDETFCQIRSGGVTIEREAYCKKLLDN